MSVFAYRGRTASGIITGEVEADDRMTVVAQLRAKGVVATAVRERAPRFGALGSWRTRRRKAKDKHLAIYTRQFSTMIDAGLPIVQCLTILSEQSESKVLRTVTNGIARDVEGGSTLADAYRKHPRTFQDLYVNMLQAGEAAGILDIVLQRLATYIEKAASLKRKVKSAMVYPSTIISVAVLVIIFMMTFVIPTFATMFAQLGADLPLPTAIVLAMSEFTRRYILLIVAALTGFVFGVRAFYRTDRGSQIIDRLMLKIPVVGTLVQKVAVARFTRTLGTLVAAGVPILEGLRITARSAGNRVVEASVMQAREAVTAGRPLSEPLRTAPVFPPMVTHMISVGESTGSLDQMLSKIADFYDDEVDSAVSALMSLLEPVMIVILGVIIGGLVVALYLPIFKIVTLIK
ncbi:MAG TPA: type II secretion system F family protein [Candidatus Acidoferrum sp.]|nr:type II secretion system F family protein [Candidatus Acidoferrum sp.]